MVAVEGSSMGLLSGDKVTYHDLLYGMLLASGNDAANTAAICLAGSQEKFAAKMNKKAKELGLANTHFVTPSGLDAPEHYTTARDLAALAKYALQNKDFAAACKAKYATLCYGNPPYKRQLKNHNKLLFSYDGLIGVKTGFTKSSGRCLVTAAKRDGKFVIAVTLKAPNDWEDHKKLLDAGFSSLTVKTLKSGTNIRYVPVVGSKIAAVRVKAKTVKAALTQSEYAHIKSKTFLPAFLYAPLKKGEQVGYITYYSGSNPIASAPLVSTQNTGAVKYKAHLGQKIKRKFKILLKAVT